MTNVLSIGKGSHHHIPCPSYTHTRASPPSTLSSEQDNAGWTPLHEACTHGYVGIVRRLLDAGADVDMPGADNDTPLHDAAVGKDEAIVRLLLEYGAVPDRVNARGRRPLDMCTDDAIRGLLRARLSALAGPVGTMTRALAGRAVAGEAMAGDVAAASPALTGLTAPMRTRHRVFLVTGLSEDEKVRL